MNNYSENKNGRIRVSQDHLWFYDEIDDKTALDFNQLLTELAQEHTKYIFNGMFEQTEPAPIWLHINSSGGNITSAMSMIDTINRIKRVVPVVTIVEGQVASAASFLSISGSHRVIRENSYMLIHQLSAGIWGNYDEIEDHNKNMKSFMKDIKKLYKKYTTIPMAKLDEILSHDIYMNAKQCKKYGLVDDIII